MNTRDIQNAIRNLDSKSLGNTGRKKMLVIIPAVALVAVLLVAVFAGGIIDFYGIKSSSQSGTNLIEPEPTKEPEKKFQGISVLRDPEWVIRYKDMSSVSGYRSCKVRNEYIDNLDGKLDFDHWCGDTEIWNALEDGNGNIYIKVSGALGTPDERKKPTENTVTYVRLLTDDQAEQILDSDEIENLTPEEIYILDRMLSLYNGQTSVEDQYINNIGFLGHYCTIYFTGKRAVMICNSWLPLDGEKIVFLPYHAKLSYSICIIPEDAYVLNNGIKQNHIYRFSNSGWPDYYYDAPDWNEISSVNPDGFFPSELWSYLPPAEDNAGTATSDPAFPTEIPTSAPSEVPTAVPT